MRNLVKPVVLTQRNQREAAVQLTLNEAAPGAKRCAQRCAVAPCSQGSQAGSTWKQREEEQPGLDLQYREADEGKKVS